LAGWLWPPHDQPLSHTVHCCCGCTWGNFEKGSSAAEINDSIQVQVDVDKPLGLVLEQSKSPLGGLVVKNASGNAAKAGIQAGDTVIYTSSFFGGFPYLQ
jgi:hypothetical protein